VYRHLEGASGILAVIKAIMMIQHGCILPNPGFEELNRNIEGREKLKVCVHLLAPVIGDERRKHKWVDPCHT
jgi:acyl transferase domain-containing protein